MTLNKLIEIPFSELHLLRDMYKVDWANNQTSYNLIDVYIKRFSVNSDLKGIKMYSLNGDYSDGTYVIIEDSEVYFNTLSDCHDRLLAALMLIDYSQAVILCGYQTKLCATVDKVIKINKIAENRATRSKFIWYYLPKEETKLFETNKLKTINIKKLSIDHAAIINKDWQFRYDGSLELIQRMIQFNENIGLFDNNNLIGWCLRYPIGSLGILRVKESCSGKGLGTEIVKIMAKRLAHLGHDTFASVSEANKASRRIFEKLGFEATDFIYWTTIKPNKTCQQILIRNS